MKLQIFLILLLLMQAACNASKPVNPKQTATVTRKNEKKVDAGIGDLSKSQKEQLKTLLAEIPAAVDAYQKRNDSDYIEEKCQKVTNDVDELTAELPDGIFKNTLQQGRDALQLAYMFRFEKEKNIEISSELRNQVLDTYKIGNLAPEKRADKIFNFAQAHFEIASRMAKDAFK